MLTSLWVAYALCLLATWFENRFIFFGVVDRPLWYTGRVLVLFGISLLALVFASLVAIWYFVGWPHALAALAAYLLLNQVTNRLYLRKAVLEHFLLIDDFLRRENEIGGVGLSEQGRRDRALSLAASQVLENTGVVGLVESHDPLRVAKILRRSGFHA